MQLRPARVPKAARFSANDGWWQVGDIVDGRPFGAWRTFRADGSPLFEARFDKKGRLQGAYKRFHPDGSLAREGSYAHGVPTGDHVYHRAKEAPGDLFPTGDARAWQVVMRYDAKGKPKSRLLLDESGRELGAPADASGGALDTEIASAKPDGYLASGALPRVLAAIGTAPEPRPDDFLLALERAPARRALTSARYQDLYGRAIATPLRAWLDAFAKGAPKLCGMRPVRDGDLAAGGNLVETLLAEYQAAPGRASALLELVSGTLAIGDAGGGRRYVLSLCEVDRDQPTDAVWLLDAPGFDMTGPVARTLDDFAYALALTSAAAGGGVGVSGVRAAYERLRGRVDLIAPMAAIEEQALGEDEDGETVGNEEGDHREGFHFRRGQRIPPYYLGRVRWILQLLCGHGEAAAASYDPRWDGQLDDKRFDIICKHAPREPWIAFYWLFRSWAFDDVRLETLLRVCGDTPSQLVRDLVALVKELAGGRVRLGEVVDLPAAKAAFRALDPQNKKPDEEEASEAEEEEEQADSTVERPPVPPALAPAVAVIDWARAEGYCRDGLLLRDETDVAGLGLALRADPAIAPFLIALADEQPWIGERFIEPWLDGDRMPLDELVAAARRWITAEQKSAHQCAIAARILARAGSGDDAKAIGAVLETTFDALFHREQGFEAAMSMMAVREAMHPMSEAVAALGVPAELVPALEALVCAETHYVDDGRGPAALALAAAGTGLDKILEGVELQLKKEHAVGAGQLLALGALGKPRAAEIAAVLARVEAEHEAGVAQQLALHDLAGTGDVAAILRAGLAEERYDDDDTAKQRVWLLDLVAKRADAPAELAAPFVYDADITVHRAAVRALRAKGAPVPPYTVYDPFHIATLSAEQLSAALADEHGLYRGNVALWLSEHPDPEAREPLAQAARRLAAAGNFPDEGPRHYELRWIVRALIAIGGADGVLDELLQHDDRNVAEPVIRYADQLGPAVAAGMTHVFVTDEHWKRGAAKAWLAKHHTDPAIPEALGLFGLAVSDVTGAEDDE